MSDDTSKRLFGHTDQHGHRVELQDGEKLVLVVGVEDALLSRDAAAVLRDALTKWLDRVAGHGASTPVRPPLTPEQEQRVRDIVVRHLSELDSERPVRKPSTPRAYRVHAPEDVTHTGTDVWGTPCTWCTHASGIHTAAAGCLAPVEVSGGISVHCECTRSGTECTGVPAIVPEVSTVSARLQPAVPDPVKLVCCGHDHLSGTPTCGFTAEPGDPPCPCRVSPETLHQAQGVQNATHAVQALASAMAGRNVKASCTCHRHDHVHEVNEFFCGAPGCFCAAPGRRSAV